MPMLKLVAEPTFKAKVAIPVAGGESVEVEFEFKHRTRDELAKYMESGNERTDVEAVLATVVGWALDDKFNKMNVERLLQNYHGAGRAIASKYYSELMALRLGNFEPSPGRSTK